MVRPADQADSIHFLLGNDPQHLTGFDPQMTVLEWLRKDAGRCGTKEGCAEGDCGACTVAIGELREDGVRYRAFNSCIQLLPTLDGKQLVTVEDLAGACSDGSGLHPVQRAMVEQHGSQCGFCTPGFVMSLFTLFHKKRADLPPDRQEIDETIAGNLCRCTGYAPIVRAAWQAMEHAPEDAFSQDAKGIADQLQELQREDMLQLEHQERRYFAPRQLSQLWHLLNEFPDAQLVAGATDVGLWLTKQLQVFDTLINLCDIQELNRLELEETNGLLFIGAAVSYSDALDVMTDSYPAMRETLQRLGAEQVRNAGTVGGNIANGSPIGDMPPALIALGARLVVSRSGGQREIPLEAFFLEYGKQDLRTGECVEAVLLPQAQPDQLFAVYKISKRFDQDISAVCGAFSIRLQNQHVIEARICFGGMAGTPLRAKNTEQLLLGQTWNAETVNRAREAMATDYTPLTDWRASGEYRLLVAQNLLQRFFLESTNGDESVQLTFGSQQ